MAEIKPGSRKVIDYLLNIPIEKLTKSENNIANFLDCKNIFIDVHKIISRLNLFFNNIIEMPLVFEEILLKPLNDMHDLYRLILDFNPRVLSTEAIGTKNVFTDKLKQYYGNLLKAISTFNGNYLFLYSDISDILFEAKSNKLEIDNILEQMRRASGSFGVSKYSAFFLEEAQKYKQKSKNWLLTTIAVAIATLVIGVYMFIDHLNNIYYYSIPQVIQLSISKLIILSVLYFGIVSGARIYKSYMHNHIINCHRANALNTFESFIQASDDPNTKNAVLLQATNAIFSHQTSGFIQKEMAPTPPVRLIDLIKNMPNSTE